MCIGCKGTIQKYTPRFKWNRPYAPEDQYRHMPGSVKEYWHVACGIITNKLNLPCNFLKPITDVTVRDMNGANERDAEVIDKFVTQDFFNLRSKLLGSVFHRPEWYVTCGDCGAVASFNLSKGFSSED